VLDLRCFPYNDGNRQVFGDPVRILRGLTVYLGGDPKPVLRASRAADPERAEGEPANDFQARADMAAVEKAVAQTRLADAARQAFNLAPRDDSSPEGYLDDDCLDLVDAFVDWLAKKNATPASSPTSASSPELPPFWARGQESQETYSESGFTSPDSDFS